MICRATGNLRAIRIRANHYAFIASGDCFG